MCRRTSSVERAQELDAEVSEIDLPIVQHENIRRISAVVDVKHRVWKAFVRINSFHFHGCFIARKDHCSVEQTSVDVNYEAVILGEESGPRWDTTINGCLNEKAPELGPA